MVHFKNRYMVMEVFIDAGRGEQDPVILTQFNITKVIRDSIQLNFGECGLAASLGSLQVKYVNPVTKLCIIRVSREDHQKVWAAITMVRCIGKIPVSFNLLDMSGEWLTLWIMTPNSVVVLGFLTLAFQCNIPAIYSFHL